MSGSEKLNTSKFEEIVYDKESPCLVIFYRKACHVCKDVIPTLEELEPRFEGHCDFYAVDVEEEKSLFNRFQLKSIPQLLFFNKGEYQGKLAGLVGIIAATINVVAGFGVTDRMLRMFRGEQQHQENGQ